MTEYVCGFAFEKNYEGPGPRPYYGGVLLIEKQKPEWQAGLWNAVGGKIEGGETAEEAMIREFAEETGGWRSVEGWKHFLTIQGYGAKVDFFKTDILSISLLDGQAPEKETLRFVPRGQIEASFPRMVPNLRWIIPLAQSTERFNGIIRGIHDAAYIS